MDSIDKEKIKKLIDWYNNDIRGEEYFYLERDFFKPIMKALGNDINMILEYLNDMNVNDLEVISGCFEDIYRKFMTDEVYDALGVLEEKLKNHIKI